jgi:hypothetical protein
MITNVVKLGKKRNSILTINTKKLNKALSLKLKNIENYELYLVHKCSEKKIAICNK